TKRETPPSAPPLVKSTATSRSPAVRPPLNFPWQGKSTLPLQEPEGGQSASVRQGWPAFVPPTQEADGTKLTGSCRNSRSTWLSPLLITRSKPANISLVSVDRKSTRLNS